jgi:putative transposase
VDNGPEFIAQALELWCKERVIELHFIRKGKPTENGLIERFNRTYREEVLDANLYETLHQVRQETNRWIWEYNNERPHESLGNIPPRTFLLKRGQRPGTQTHASDLPTFQQDDHTNDSTNFTKDRA